MNVTTTPRPEPAGDIEPAAPSPARPSSRDDEHSLFQAVKSRIVRLAPRPIVRALAKPYIAGETREEAMRLVARLWREKSLYSTVDILGEAITDPAQSVEMLGEYLAVLDAIGASPNANISVKLSALGQGLDDDLCGEQLGELLARAETYGQFVRLDMEDASTVDSTLGFYERFVGRYPKIGVVLQSRLFRTESDVRRLAPLRANVRLCIGIYNEPPAIALQRKPEMKDRLLDLLALMWEQGQYVAIATHDEQVIRRALALAERMDKSPDAYEVQMLLGVPRDALQRELMGRGIRVRLYIPYGKRWYQYCLRRLEHNPEMASLVVKNLLGIGS